MSEDEKKMTEDKKNSDDRLENGRFKVGCKGGPGNPYVNKVMEYRRILTACVNKKQFKLIVKAMIRSAKTGDVKAAQVLLERVLGKEKAHIALENPQKLYDLAESDSVGSV